jgi:acetoin utilization deacetylase AcuC-like enzyme
MFANWVYRHYYCSATYPFLTLQATHDALTMFENTGSGCFPSSQSPSIESRGSGTTSRRTGIACNQAGGTHHAFRDSGEGFCIFNDIAVAAKYALSTPRYGVQKVLVIDLDVHQGNGTAGILADDKRVITFSMHGAKNYPWSSRFPSTLDVDVPDGAGDDIFLPMLEDALRQLDALIRVDGKAENPIDTHLVYFQAGVDPLKHDRLGRLALTRSGLHTRNDMVYRWCEDRSLPLVVTMGGGYARPIELSARCHVDVFLQASQSWRRRSQQ